MSHDMMALLSFDDVHSFNGDYCRYAKSGNDIGVDGQCKVATNALEVAKMMQSISFDKEEIWTRTAGNRITQSYILCFCMRLL